MKRIQIGERLRSAREQAGFSRDSACAKVGVSRTTLQQWENGATEASIEALDKLAKLYKTSPQFLIFGEITSPLIDGNSDEEYEDVLVYDVLASAGVGSAVFEENASCRLKFPSWWFAERRLSPAKVVGLYTRPFLITPCYCLTAHRPTSWTVRYMLFGLMMSCMSSVSNVSLAVA